MISNTASMREIVLASGNRGKLAEFQQLLKGSDFDVLLQSDFNVPEAEETGLSFVENAIIKARNAAKHTGLPALADDSGLEVDALNGKPGIYSARYAGTRASDLENCNKLLVDLQAVPKEKRCARFQCLLVFLRHAEDPTPLIYQGTWEGSILFKPQGVNGFGYDPLFYTDTQHCSSAELSPELKNTISHRGQAMAKLVQHWQATNRTDIV